MQSTTERVPADGATAIEALSENDVVLLNGHIYRVSEVDAGPSTGRPRATLWDDRWEAHDLIVLPDGQLGLNPQYAGDILQDADRVESFATLETAGEAMLRSATPDVEDPVVETLLDVDVPLRPAKPAILRDEWGVLREEPPPIGTTGAKYVGPASSLVVVERHHSRFRVRAGRRDDHPPMYSYCSEHHRLVDALRAAGDVIEAVYPDPIPLDNPVPSIGGDDTPAALPAINGWTYDGQSPDLELWTWSNTDRGPRRPEVIELSRIHAGDTTNDWRVQLAQTGQRKRETLVDALRVVALEMAQSPAPTGWQPGHPTPD